MLKIWNTLQGVVGKYKIIGKQFFEVIKHLEYEVVCFNNISYNPCDYSSVREDF